VSLTGIEELNDRHRQTDR